MNAEAATDLARDALIWLAGRPEMLGGFLAASGADAGELRARMQDPEFLGFLLDFLLGSDDMVRDFTAGAGLPPEAVLRARAALPGGDVPDWT